MNFFYEFENFQKIFENFWKNLKIFEKMKIFFNFWKNQKKFEKIFGLKKMFSEKKISIPYPNAVTSQKSFEIGPAV